MNFDLNKKDVYIRLRTNYVFYSKLSSKHYFRLHNILRAYKISLRLYLKFLIVELNIIFTNFTIINNNIEYEKNILLRQQLKNA